ncbi:MAG: FG-GAP-like repeat-containing protein [Candidatus Acidiferrales bacterium]
MSKLYSWGVGVLVVAMAAVTCACSSSSGPITVTLSPSSPQTIDQGQTATITATVANDSSSNGVSWSLMGPGSLSNQATTSVTYNPPTPSLAGAQQATITATSLSNQRSSAMLQFIVNPYLQIPFQSLPNGSVGAPYSQPIALAGGTGPFQWSIYNGPILTGSSVGGSVPDGLHLDPNSGTISGTPTGAGTWYFEATVTDATGISAVNGSLSLQINPTAAPGNPVPFLNQPLVPTAVSPGSPTFTLRVSGSGFVSGSTIDFNGAPLATTVLKSQHLSATVPATDVATAATAAVTVVNPAPGGGSSNVVYFQVGAPESTVTFANAANSPFEIAEPFGIVAADFNEDGKPDLAIAANIRTYVFLGNGNGTFAPAANSPLPVPSPPYDDFATPFVGPLAVGDFNHSGHLGLAVAEFGNEAAVILLGNGTGTLSPSSAGFANSLGQSTSAIAAADFNQDGNLDLSMVSQIAQQSPVVLGYGDGAFIPAGDLFITGFPSGMAVGDFNNDGMLDVVVAGSGSQKFPQAGLAVSLGKGDGTFTSAPNSPISVPIGLSAIVAADFNGDGNLDLAVTNSTTNTVTILLGNGNGTFGTPSAIPVGKGPVAIVAGDFNNDGKLDLAVVNSLDGTVTLLLGNGDGTFTQATGSPSAVGSGPSQIVAADFNGDGKLDLAVLTTANDGTVSIFLQQ